MPPRKISDCFSHVRPREIGFHFILFIMAPTSLKWIGAYHNVYHNMYMYMYIMIYHEKSRCFTIVFT